VDTVATRRKLIIAAIGVALLAGLPATALAVFPGANGEIVFVSGRDTGGDAQADIYTIDGPLDLTLTGPLTLVAGQHRHPNWSPDAKRVVVVVRDGANDDVWLRDIELGSGINFTQSPTIREDHPTFSPDGTKIAYESEVTDGNDDTDIIIENVDGSGSPLNLTPTPTTIESTPVWGPNGNRIYYARKAVGMAGEYDIVHEPADNSGSPTILPDAGSGIDEWQPEISPDGTKVCFTFGPLFSANADVYVANIDGAGTPFEFNANDTAMPVADYNCGWSPDGETIGFTRGLTSAGNLYFGPSGGAGDPVVYGNNDSNDFDGNLDWARVPGKCDGRNATIAGDSGADDLVGTPGKDVIVTFEGNDRVKGKGGNDRICAGKGRDTVSGVKGKDRLFGGPGPDKLNGGPDKDRCDGGPGNDIASGCEKRKSI
jgi:hypothetical protein